MSDAMTAAGRNRKLGFLINKEIWNEQKFEKIPQFFAEDFVADYSPRGIHCGRDQVEGMVRRSHLAFEGFREEIRHLIADDDHIVVHFTVTGKQVGQWGPVPPTGRLVQFDEVVIMTVRDGKVCRQVGVADTLLGLQQVGLIPDPAGIAKI